MRGRRCRRWAAFRRQARARTRRTRAEKAWLRQPSTRGTSASPRWRRAFASRLPSPTRIAPRIFLTRRRNARAGRPASPAARRLARRARRRQSSRARGVACQTRRARESRGTGRTRSPRGDTSGTRVAGADLSTPGSFSRASRASSISASSISASSTSASSPSASGRRRSARTRDERASLDAADRNLARRFRHRHRFLRPRRASAEAARLRPRPRRRAFPGQPVSRPRTTAPRLRRSRISRAPRRLPLRSLRRNRHLRPPLPPPPRRPATATGTGCRRKTSGAYEASGLFVWPKASFRSLHRISLPPSPPLGRSSPPGRRRHLPLRRRLPPRRPATAKGTGCPRKTCGVSARAANGAPPRPRLARASFSSHRRCTRACAAMEDCRRGFGAPAAELDGRRGGEGAMLCDGASAAALATTSRTCCESIKQKSGDAGASSSWGDSCVGSSLRGTPPRVARRRGSVPARAPATRPQPPAHPGRSSAPSGSKMRSEAARNPPGVRLGAFFSAPPPRRLRDAARPGSFELCRRRRRRRRRPPRSGRRARTRRLGSHRRSSGTRGTPSSARAGSRPGRRSREVPRVGRAPRRAPRWRMSRRSPAPAEEARRRPRAGRETDSHPPRRARVSCGARASPPPAHRRSRPVGV